MNSNLRLTFPARPARHVTALLLLAFVAGCGREEVKVYRVAKETPETAAHAHTQLPTGHPEITGTAHPRLTWKTPEGWKEQPASQMRAASFTVAGKDGQVADVSVIPLPTTGREEELVNMWRTQMKLATLGADAAAKVAEPVTIGAEQGKLFDMASEQPVIEDKLRGRILVAMVDRGGMSWFFKMSGEESLVREQKPAFVEFLKSVEFAPPAPAAELAALPPSHPPIDGAAVAAQSPSSPAANDGTPNWQVPAGWREAPAGQFLVAKFLVDGDPQGQTAVNVSTSSGEGGGLLANVNRWREQLGLPPLGEAELAASTRVVELAGGKATFVEMSGTDARTRQPARVIGAIVPQPGQTWFYKLMGDAKLVEGQKEAFAKFVQSVKY